MIFIISLIETMQVSLKQIRQVLGFGVQEFGDLIGLTRQTVNNLETQKNRMSSIQYIAVCAIIDNYITDKPELLPILSTILCSNENNHRSNVFETIEKGSLLKKWFLCFSDESKMFGLSLNNTSLISSKDFGNIAESYRIFLDQTVLFEEGFLDILQSFALALKNSGNKFIVPLKVVEAIQHQMMSSETNDVLVAQKGMKLLMELQNENLIDIRGEKSDGNVISTFVSVFAKFKSVNRLALMTRNPKLAKQGDTLNNDVLGGFNILVLDYSKDKGIQKWTQDDYKSNEQLTMNQFYKSYLLMKNC